MAYMGRLLPGRAREREYLAGACWLAGSGWLAFWWMAVAQLRVRGHGRRLGVVDGWLALRSCHEKYIDFHCQILEILSPFKII
jgi:hypothetical protein